MKEITLLSGKGGTGKTSIAAAFATLADKPIVCDNDVDAANLHLLLKPEIIESNLFAGGEKAIVDAEKCTGCGLCINSCRFGAIKWSETGIPLINLLDCEGCRLCMNICPDGAIKMTKLFNNRWYISNTRVGTMVHTEMAAGEENSGRLVTQLRNTAKKLALQMNSPFIISDGPPGIGCPVIASLTGTDAVILVIEPTVSGIHDAIRLFELALTFHLPVYVIINKEDINKKLASEAKSYFKEKSITICGSIPFDKNIIKAMTAGLSIIEYAPLSKTSIKIKKAWELIVEHIEKKQFKLLM